MDIYLWFKRVSEGNHTWRLSDTFMHAPREHPKHSQKHLCCPQPFMPCVLFPFRDIRGCAEGDVICSSARTSGDAWGMDGSRTKAFHSLITPIPRTCPQAPSPGAKTCWIFMFLLTEVFYFGHMVRSGVKRKLTFSYWTECPCFYLRTGSCLGLSSLEKRSCSRHRN